MWSRKPALHFVFVVALFPRSHSALLRCRYKRAITTTTLSTPTRPSLHSIHGPLLIAQSPDGRCGRALPRLFLFHARGRTRISSRVRARQQRVRPLLLRHRMNYHRRSAALLQVRSVSPARLMPRLISCFAVPINLPPFPRLGVALSVRRLGHAGQADAVPVIYPYCIATSRCIHIPAASKLSCIESHSCSANVDMRHVAAIPKMPLT